MKTFGADGCASRGWAESEHGQAHALLPSGRVPQMLRQITVVEQPEAVIECRFPASAAPKQAGSTAHTDSGSSRTTAITAARERRGSIDGFDAQRTVWLQATVADLLQERLHFAARVCIAAALRGRDAVFEH